MLRIGGSNLQESDPQQETKSDMNVAAGSAQSNWNGSFHSSACLHSINLPGFVGRLNFVSGSASQTSGLPLFANSAIGVRPIAQGCS
jgi:hypothetical protein